MCVCLCVCVEGGGRKGVRIICKCDIAQAFPFGELKLVNYDDAISNRKYDVMIVILMSQQLRKQKFFVVSLCLDRLS